MLRSIRTFYGVIATELTANLSSVSELTNKDDIHDIEATCRCQLITLVAGATETSAELSQYVNEKLSIIIDLVHDGKVKGEVCDDIIATFPDKIIENIKREDFNTYILGKAFTQDGLLKITERNGVKKDDDVTPVTDDDVTPVTDDDVTPVTDDDVTANKKKRGKNNYVYK